MLRFKIMVSCLVASMTLLSGPWLVVAGPKRHDPAPPQVSTRPAYIFDNCDLPTVFKMLANEAHVVIDMDPSIQGTLNMQLNDVDARAAIGVIAASENLRLQKEGEMYHVKPAAGTEDARKSDAKSSNDLFETFSQAMAKAYDGVLDYLAKPELAEKIAKQKRVYYLALMKEGFTSDEALRIVVASSGSELPTIGASNK